jgi:hypothetical protein
MTRMRAVAGRSMTLKYVVVNELSLKAWLGFVRHGTESSEEFLYELSSHQLVEKTRALRGCLQV